MDLKVNPQVPDLTKIDQVNGIVGRVAPKQLLHRDWMCRHEVPRVQRLPQERGRPQAAGRRIRPQPVSALRNLPLLVMLMPFLRDCL